MREKLRTSLNDAMKARDKRRAATLRLVTAAIKDRDIDARGNGREQIGDDEILALLQKMVKQRKDSIDIYNDQGRDDLAKIEEEEVVVISKNSKRDNHLWFFNNCMVIE